MRAGLSGGGGVGRDSAEEAVRTLPSGGGEKRCQVRYCPGNETVDRLVSVPPSLLSFILV